MEPNNAGLEDDFPFQLGDFQVPAISFGGPNDLSSTPQHVFFSSGFCGFDFFFGWVFWDGVLG